MILFLHILIRKKLPEILDNHYLNYDDVKDDIENISLEQALKLLDNLSFDENPDAEAPLDHEK